MRLRYHHRIDLGDGPAFDIGRLRIVCLSGWWPKLPYVWRNDNARGFSIGYLSILWMEPHFARLLDQREDAAKNE